MNLFGGYSLDIQRLHYVPVCTRVCLLETCVCYNLCMVYVILHHRHLFKNINIVIHVQYVGESSVVKIFMWSLFKISVHIVNLNYAGISYQSSGIIDHLPPTPTPTPWKGLGKSMDSHGEERATWSWTGLTPNPGLTVSHSVVPNEHHTLAEPHLSSAPRITGGLAGGISLRSIES